MPRRPPAFRSVTPFGPSRRPAQRRASVLSFAVSRVAPAADALMEWSGDERWPDAAWRVRRGSLHVDSPSAQYRQLPPGARVIQISWFMITNRERPPRPYSVHVSLASRLEISTGPLHRRPGSHG